MKSPVIKSALKYKKQIILGPFFKIFEVIGELLSPFFVAYIIDNFIYIDSTGNITGEDLKYVVYAFLIMVGIAIFAFSTTLITQRMAITSGAALSDDLRNKIFEKYQSLSKKDVDKVGKDKFLTLLNVDTNNVETGFQIGIRLLIRSPILIIGSITCGFLIDVKCGFIFLGILFLASLIIVFTMIYLGKHYRDVQEKVDEMYTIAGDDVSGARAIRAFNNEEKEVKRFKTVSESYKKRKISLSLIEKINDPLTTLVINCGIVLILYFGQFDISAGKLSSGDIVCLINLLNLALLGLIAFVKLINNLTRGYASRKRIDEFLNIEPSFENSNKYKELKVNIGDELINFNNVNFSYSGTTDTYTLKNINFSINKGQTIGIIGGTGSGKTTLISLLEHFYEATNGEIIYKNHDIKDYDIVSLRNEICLVNQKPQFLKGTIKSNMLLGKENATDEEIFNALRLAKADFVFDYSDGILHDVEENGSNFSGGQKQRLNIARAILKNGEILVLDDSTSALDFVTDKKVRENIKNLDKNLTTIIVSQRTNLLNYCDKIIVLDKGEIESIGTHEELLNISKIYREIYQIQAELK